MHPARYLRLGGLLSGILLLALLLSGCSSGIASFDVVSRQGHDIRWLFLLVMILSALVFLLVASILIFVLLRYRAGRVHQEPRQVTGNRKIEFIWTAIPVVILTVLFILSIQAMHRVEAVQGKSSDPIHVEIIGHQWWWEYRYTDYNIDTANELVLPAGEPVTLKITSDDVIHSFWVPEIGWKQDAIPTKMNTMQVTLDRPGSWEGTCSQYCGAQHAWMRILVVAKTPQQFTSWVRQHKQPAPAPVSALAKQGEQLYMSSTCVSCHTIAGTDSKGTVGPNLTHLADRKYIGSGVLTNTPAHLKEWVADAQSVKPDILMPRFNFTSQQLDEIVAYLEGLK